MLTIDTDLPELTGDHPGGSDLPGPIDRTGAVITDHRRTRWILVAMCTALVAVIASVSGLNVAQQALAADLGASQGQLLWIINGYTLALAALLLPIGAIGDRWGRKHVLVGGLGLFVASSVASAFATTVTMLLATRVAAGVAAAMIMPVTLSIITSSFPADERDRAVGVWAGFAGAGGILGLLASSVVIDHGTWPWVFTLPVVLAVAALVLTLRVVPHSREDHAGRFDVGGALLSFLAIGGLVLGIQEGPERGWSAPLTIAGLAVGALAAFGFIAWERRSARPLLDVSVFRHRAVSAGSLTLLLVFAVLMGMFLVVVQFLQAVLGWSALRASAGLLPMAGIMLPLSALAPLLARRLGQRTMLVAGSLTVSGGLALLATMGSASGGYLSVLPGLLITSVGVGLSMTPSTTAITGGMPAEAQGVASALNDTVREFGGALGIALLGSLASAGYRHGVARILPMMPKQAADAVNSGIGGAVYVARQAGPQGGQLLRIARDAFVDGWTTAMWASAALMAATAVALVVLAPRHFRP